MKTTLAAAAAALMLAGCATDYYAGYGSYGYYDTPYYASPYYYGSPYDYYYYDYGYPYPYYGPSIGGGLNFYYHDRDYRGWRGRDWDRGNGRDRDWGRDRGPRSSAEIGTYRGEQLAPGAGRQAPTQPSGPAGGPPGETAQQ